MNVPLLAAPESRWECPNCDLTHVTRGRSFGQPFHNCRGLRGLSAPFVTAGTKAKVETVERGDYIGKEQVQQDGEGRPVMAIQTTRDEGQDCAVLAPVAGAQVG